MCSEAVLQRCSPERCSANMKQAHRRTTMQKCHLHKTALKSHPRMDTPSKICSSHAEQPPPGEHLIGGLLLYVKRVLKDLNYKKLLFTVVKRNLFTHKNKLVFRFFHSYFTLRFYIN